MILIIADRDDAHSRAVAKELGGRGTTVEFFDFADFPQQAEIMLEVSDKGNRLCILTPQRSIDFSEVRTVLYRRPHPPLVSYPQDPDAESYIREECLVFLESLPLLSHCRWVSSPIAVRTASQKPYQLLVAREVGFAIPPSVIGNSPSAVSQFSQSQTGDMAVKPLTKPYIREDAQGRAIYTFTQKLSREALAERAVKVRPCPVIVQGYVEKKLELRITVVGNSTFACAIHSQANEQTKTDWRRYNIPATPHRVYTLPEHVERRCVALTEKLGLEFGCIDLIVTPDDDYVFVEINPIGQWLWIEELTGMPISEALAALLLEKNA